MRKLTLAVGLLSVTVALLAMSATAFAQTVASVPQRRPIVLFGGRYAAPTRFTGGAGLLIPFGKPSKNGDLGDTEGHRGLEVEASAGLGGARLAIGPAFVGKPPAGPVLFAGDVLVGLTRTWNSPRQASPQSSYVGVEGGVTLLMVRLAAGLAHRVAGPEGPDATVFTWGVGVQTGW